MSQRLDFAPFRTHNFFLVTTLLAIIAWFLTFTSQAIATAQFGHASVGALWFAIFLQGFLISGVICTIATDSIQTSRLQLAVFGAVAIVSSVQGVEQGVYSGRPALDAMGEDSLALHIFNRLGTGGLAPPSRRRRTRGQSVVSSAVGYTKGKTNYSLGGGVSSVDLENEAKREGVARSATGGALARSGTGERSITSRKSLVSATHGDVELSPPPMPEPPTFSPLAVPVVRDLKAGNLLLSTSPDDDAEAPLRAKALHAYHGSPEDPNELSFAKGEILEIDDQEGKWWQAKKADGTLGIVPSNYLVVI
ncbi:hypothetical protein B0H17DRAFT_1202743 [Mycena rosella]|uniref:SH3 domain-containing protein n=1 Tax=Mycena rosella TaxID=1033263 RepID=A0AAD7GFP7_MYCRO|nr:hypothetical protein B0H17DRAFT_1202743 [Mycena rosella]